MEATKAGPYGKLFRPDNFVHGNVGPSILTRLFSLLIIGYI